MKTNRSGDDHEVVLEDLLVDFNLIAPRSVADREETYFSGLAPPLRLMARLDKRVLCQDRQ